MKNLLIYIGPTKEFTKEHEELTEMQIDNSLALGWGREDILSSLLWLYLLYWSLVIQRQEF